MTLSPLLAAHPMVLGTARGVAQRLPGQAAAFFQVLASAVGGAPEGDVPPAAAAESPKRLATIGSSLVDGLRNLAVDQPTQALQAVRQRLSEVLQKAGKGDAGEGVRVRITAAEGIRVVGAPPHGAAIQTIVSADPALTELVSHLPGAWLESGLEMTLRRS